MSGCVTTWTRQPTVISASCFQPAQALDMRSNIRAIGGSSVACGHVGLPPRPATSTRPERHNSVRVLPGRAPASAAAPDRDGPAKSANHSLGLAA